MRLLEALRVTAGRVVAFTGAGGKSSAIGRLAAELAPQVPVVVTTTTRLALGQRGLARHHLIVRSEASLDLLEDSLSTERSVLVTGPPAADEPKWVGISGRPLETVRRVAAGMGAVLLIEADGARGLSLKAPAEHEPMVPAFTGLTVPVAGLDVIGTGLHDGLVHRPELAAPLLWLAAGERIGPTHLARLMTAREGGLQGIPPASEVRILLNKAETPERLEAGRIAAQAILAAGRVHGVVLASATADKAASEVFGRVGGVVLAGGASKRMHRPKQLLAWRGRPLVWHAVRAALEGGLSPVVVVLGSSADDVRQAVGREPVKYVLNQEWVRGQSTSVRAGLLAVEAARVEAACFLLCDTPFVGSAVVRAVVAEHRRSLTPIVAPRVEGRWGNPVLFDRVTFPDLRSLEGDRGGRALFERYRMAGIEWDASVLTDLDTPEDLVRLGLVP